MKANTRRPWVCYPGSFTQQTFAEGLRHGYLQWDIKSRESFDVKFIELPNPKPFVTFEWTGDVLSTLSNIDCDKFRNARFRISSESARISQHDCAVLTEYLTKRADATEVTFKNFDVCGGNSYTALTDETDYRDVGTLVTQLREFYKSVSEEELDEACTRLTEYVSRVETEDARNVKWSIESLSFDNLFGYGEGNEIDFTALKGIVGIFGENRIGKSSIPGTLMYTLFNGSDRGKIKNSNVCNVRKEYCRGIARLNVSGVSYSVDRRTNKRENKQGEAINAITTLDLVCNGTDNLKCEARADTDKELRKLIGTADDFLLMSLSAQGKVNHFVDQGPTVRWTVLSRFLDLGVFQQIHDFARSDLNAQRVLLKRSTEKEWEHELSSRCKEIDDCEVAYENLSRDLHDIDAELVSARAEVSDNNEIVTEAQLVAATDKLSSLQSDVEHTTMFAKELRGSCDVLQDKLAQLDQLRSSMDDLQKLRDKLAETLKRKATVSTQASTLEQRQQELNASKRAAKLLRSIPCNGQFPDCKFVHDACTKSLNLSRAESRVEDSLQKYNAAVTSLGEADVSLLTESVKKLEKLDLVEARIQTELATKSARLASYERDIDTKTKAEQVQQTVVSTLREAFENVGNANVLAIRKRIDALQERRRIIDRSKFDAAATKGRLTAEMAELERQREERLSLIKRASAYELISRAFSKKGIPNAIIASRLPKINAEIAEILRGIVDFTVEFQHDGDSDIDLYVNYGDSRRIIEVCSGMEKMIASIAVRVAMNRVSTLPKSDIFVIDEGFGSLDALGIEACNRLIVSLKERFKVVVVITHVDDVKSIADHIIEIVKYGHDAQVKFHG